MTKEELEQMEDVVKTLSLEELLLLTKEASAQLLKENQEVYEALTYK